MSYKRFCAQGSRAISALVWKAPSVSARHRYHRPFSVPSPSAFASTHRSRHRLEEEATRQEPRNNHLLFGVRHITIFFCFDASFASSLRVDHTLFRHLFSFRLNYKRHCLTIAQLTHRSSLRENKRVNDKRHCLDIYITPRRRHRTCMFLARSDILKELSLIHI